MKSAIHGASRRPLTQPESVKLTLWVGLIAGTLDITENIVFNLFRGITPCRIFQYIASGLLGMKAFSMGYGSVVLGVAIHYAIALVWTVIFYAASRKFVVLIRRPAISGLFYSCLVYLIMTFAVLPLTHIPHATAAVSTAARINAVLALIFCIGLPIAFLFRWLSASA